MHCGMGTPYLHLKVELYARNASLMHTARIHSQRVIRYYLTLIAQCKESPIPMHISCHAVCGSALHLNLQY